MASSVFTIAFVMILSAAMLEISSSWPTEYISHNSPRSKRSTIIDTENPEDVLRVLVKLAQDIIDTESFVHEKRGIDLGLSRGFSGSQAAKHLMGLAAANFANGPGRKRRDVSEQ